MRDFSVSRASSTLEVRLSWEHDPQRGETVLFAPQALFAEAPKIRQSEGVQCSYGPDASLLQCVAAEGGIKQVSVAGASAP